ncbi:MAG TPA: Imm1 family immunity protein [Pseudonocardiaceae bacterium]|nr:Imm1 family immunity protein [Pseudonocardiaceae bacterium]
MRFTLYWGTDNTARINSVDDLDIHLTLLARSRGRARTPYAVDLLPADARDGGLQLGIGHPERAFVLALDRPSGYAVEPGVALWPGPIAFDCGHEVIELKPEWTRVTAEAAVEAARRYVRTGTRPTNLDFDRIAVRS